MSVDAIVGTAGKNGSKLSDNQTYVSATTKIDTILEELNSNTPIKAEMIIKRFEEMGDDSDPRAIATDFGFRDHHELGDYGK